MNELIADIAGSALRLAGVSPAVTGAVVRLIPKVIDYARDRIAAGADPVVEPEVMLAGAEEQAIGAARAKFGV